LKNEQEYEKAGPQNSKNYTNRSKTFPDFKETPFWK